MIERKDISMEMPVEFKLLLLLITLCNILFQTMSGKIKNHHTGKKIIFKVYLKQFLL